MTQPVTSMMVMTRGGGRGLAALRKLLLAEAAACMAVVVGVALGGSLWWLLAALPAAAASAGIAVRAAARDRQARRVYAPRYGVVRGSDGSQYGLVFTPSAEDPLVYIGRQAGSGLPVPCDADLSYAVEVDALAYGQTVHVSFERQP